MSTPRKPDLDRLVTALTADGRPDELAGRDAARRRVPRGRPARRGRRAARRRRVPVPPAVCRAARGGWPPSAPSWSSPWPGSPRRPTRRRCPARCRDLAHTVFAPLGVPDSQPASPATRPPSPSRRPAGSPGGPAARRPRRPRRGRETTTVLTLTASRRAGAGRRGRRVRRPGHRPRPRRRGRPRPAVRTARRVSHVGARGHRGDRPARRVQAAEPAADDDRGLPGGRARTTRTAPRSG